MTIESPHNEKLKLVRKLRDRKHRERERLFATEGEDLLEVGLAAGAEPKFVLVASGARSSLHAAGESRSTLATYTAGKVDHGAERAGKVDHGAERAGKVDHGAVDPRLAFDEVEPGLLASVSSLGSGTRAIAVWPLIWADPPSDGAPCVYLHAVGDPGNVGTIVRTAHALLDATVVLGPDCADPFGPKAARASMGSIFARPPARAAVAATPEPRAALVAHGGAGLDSLAGAATLCLGAEREGLPDDVLAACQVTATIPLAGDAESLNVAAAAAIACERLGASVRARISSPAMSAEAADA